MQSKDRVRFEGISAEEFRTRAGMDASGFLELALPKARDVRDEAYAPYSGFHVGAALLVDGGEVFCGANVENASYGLAICAERSAATAAVSHGRRGFKAIAIVGADGAGTAPCGACRQFLSEFNARLPVVYATSEGYRITAVDQLLPDAFGPASFSAGR
ncbi:MAG TPA: cytidine deaminase [Candidatus Rubrimentiphilum sp.]|nr:cytidine deaminase [Candidatus Rubrimentiphilum sp.]